jgi:hypothetical protein
MKIYNIVQCSIQSLVDCCISYYFESLIIFSVTKNFLSVNVFKIKFKYEHSYVHSCLAIGIFFNLIVFVYIVK